MTAQLQFRNLTLGYDRHPAVHHLDGAVSAGSLTAVVGPNGAGKSTLFKGVVGVIKPLAGRIVILLMTVILPGFARRGESDALPRGLETPVPVWCGHEGMPAASAQLSCRAAILDFCCSLCRELEKTRGGRADDLGVAA